MVGGYFFFLFNETRYVNANIMRFYYFRFFVCIPRARVLDGVFTTSNVRDTILWLLVVIENIYMYKKKSRLTLMSLENANTGDDGGGGDGGDRLFSRVYIQSRK